MLICKIFGHTPIKPALWSDCTINGMPGKCRDLVCLICKKTKTEQKIQTWTLLADGDHWD